MRQTVINGILCSLFVSSAVAQVRQNPSPMVETTREHPRLERARPPGRRFELELGTLYLPDTLSGRDTVPLFIHFHGGEWLPEVAAARDGRRAVISIQLGNGSRVYATPFKDEMRFTRLIDEAEAKGKLRFSSVGLTAWSAGYGAVREILKGQAYHRIHFVLLIDGLHAGYISGSPGPKESELVPADLDIFLRFARDAVAGNKQLIITHTEIFPGTFASTTETADYLLKQLHLRRTAVLKWGPMGTQQLSEVRAGQLHVLGYAGNSAPDHIDHLHALPELLKLVN